MWSLSSKESLLQAATASAFGSAKLQDINASNSIEYIVCSIFSSEFSSVSDERRKKTGVMVVALSHGFTNPPWLTAAAQTAGGKYAAGLGAVRAREPQLHCHSPEERLGEGDAWAGCPAGPGAAAGVCQVQSKRSHSSSPSSTSRAFAGLAVVVRLTASHNKPTEHPGTRDRWAVREVKALSVGLACSTCSILAHGR